MITEKVIEILALHLDKDPSVIKPETVLMDEFDIDSLDIVELIMNMESAFNIVITDDSLPNVKTVQDIVDYVQTSLQGKQ